MFKLFRRNVKLETKASPSAEKAASVLAKAMLRVQSLWANWLSTQEKKMSLKQKKLGLALFCIWMSMLAGIFLYRGIYVKPETSPQWLKPPSVIFPEDTRLPDSLNLEYLRELYRQRQAERLENDSIHN